MNIFASVQQFLREFFALPDGEYERRNGNRQRKALRADPQIYISDTPGNRGKKKRYKKMPPQNKHGKRPQKGKPVKGPHYFSDDYGASAKFAKPYRASFDDQVDTSVDIIEQSGWDIDDYPRPFVEDDVFGFTIFDHPIGGFDGIVGPCSADPLERASWGGGCDDMFTHDSINDSLSNSFSDDLFTNDSFNDTCSSWDD